jgi:2-dehydro-3-deoxyphosphogluconate aldolase/(4S)-4-hydroxy-2-oxoglutarate aldolase
MHINNIMRLSPVVPVVTLHDADDAVPVARALLAGGLKTIELTLRTPAALDAIRAIAAEVPELVLGAGTILNAAQLDAATEAGAAFHVSPGMTPQLLAEADRRGVAFLPGVATASEVMMALEYGFDCLKLFPAAQLGIATLKAFAGPLPQALFCCNGGITLDNGDEFLRQPNVIALGCSWVVTEALVAARDWAGIEANARAAAALGTA